MTLPASQTQAVWQGTIRDGGRSTARAGSSEEAAVLTLDERGTILDCSRAAESLFGYRRSEMVWRHVSMLLPQLAKIDLMTDGQPNPDLRFRCRIGRLFHSVAHNGEHFASELYFTVLSSEGCNRLLLIVRPVAETAESEGQIELL